MKHKKPIKVLHVIGGLGLGGAQVYLKSVMENVDSRQVATWVYPLRAKLREIPISGQVIELNYPNYDPRKFFAMIKLCRKHQIDILHAHLHKPVIGCLLASFFCNAKVIVHEHGPIFRRGLQYTLYRWLLRLFCYRADRFIAVSKATSQELVKKAHVSPEKITVLYNPIDPTRFDPTHALRNQMREQLNLSPKDIVLGFVGRLHPVKGPDILIDAMALLLKKNPNYKLLLIGDGPQRKSLQAQAQKLAINDQVQFLGFQENIPDLIQTFDLAIIPSRQEAFGIVAVELMQSKIPLVCSAVEGLTELAIHNETAWVASQNTSAQIAMGVEKLQRDMTLRKHLVESAWSFSQKFAVEDHLKALTQVYDQLTNWKSTL